MPETAITIFKGIKLTMNKRKLEWIWDGRIPRGYISVLAAEGGIGKSGLALYLADKFTGEGMKVMYVDAEKCDTHIAERFRTWNLPHANSIYFTGKIRHDGDYATGVYGSMVSLVRILAEEKPDLVILDSLTSLGSAYDLNQSNNVAAFYKVLEELTEKGNAAVLIIAHLRKPMHDGETEIRNSAISGSAAIVNLARSVMLMKEDQKNPDNRILVHGKCNMARLAQDLIFSVSPLTGEISNFHEAPKKRVKNIVVTPGSKIGKIRDTAMAMITEGKDKKEILAELKTLGAVPMEVSRLRVWLKDKHNITF